MSDLRVGFKVNENYIVTRTQMTIFLVLLYGGGSSYLGLQVFGADFTDFEFSFEYVGLLISDYRLLLFLIAGPFVSIAAFIYSFSLSRSDYCFIIDSVGIEFFFAEKQFFPWDKSFIAWSELDDILFMLDNGEFDGFIFTVKGGEEAAPVIVNRERLEGDSTQNVNDLLATVKRFNYSLYREKVNTELWPEVESYIYT